LKYERRRSHPIPLSVFVGRMLRHASVAGAIVLLSLLAGMVGYHFFERLPWIDSFLNAAMLLGGMGPVESPTTTGGKLFAGAYALYAGLVFLVAAGVIFTPVMHRILHQFHAEGSDTDK
jgi:hypothetical protein